MSFDSPACQELRGKIPTDWEVGLLGAVTDFQEGPGILAKDFKDSGVPLLRLRNIEGQRVQLAGCNFLDPEKVSAKWSHFGLRKGDLLISTSASLGRVSVVGPESVGAIAYTGIIRFRSRSPLLHHEYLRAFLSSKTFVEQAERMATGSVIKHFGPSHLRQMAITLPPLETQVQIAELFDVLDDRITLLRETNATLEAIAQALFKSWFVDFDPVRAKMAGRAPEGMDEATAALFPDALEETELGLVPKGWVHQAISDVVEGVYDGPHATPPEADSGGVFLGIKNLTGTALDLSEIRFIGDAEWAKWTKRVEPRAGDIVFSYEATLGFFALIPPNLRCCLGRRLALIRPKNKDGAGHFWFHQFVAQPFQVLLAKHTIHGATVNRIALKEFPSYTVLVPPLALQRAFDQVAASLWLRIHANQAQVRSLAQLRDELLPRLISGQLRLPEAQAHLEEALA
ncbi:restriction endonuclease subunit S [Paracidovorax avenae]|uniref:restriction endonuclease subunit S n=1 Tax=Paracidovorax avenae TaxID=80867 RepID=UPI001863A3D6|nr:restriction endonuclease subunit S [Paracidovorax avenae]